MNFTVLTIFPELIQPFFFHGIIGKAIENSILSASTMDIRDFAKGKHRVTDDRPYGGGCGMVMKPEPLAGAIRAAKEKTPQSSVIHLTPQGRPFSQKVARELAVLDGMILVCGRYEGVDERVCQGLIDDEISIGDYVLTGGELAALVVIEAVARLVPGALGGDQSAEKDTFEDGLIEHAHYTRPDEFEGDKVPGVLLSGNHAEIEKWRLESSLKRTFLKRPDLFKEKKLSKQEKEILEKWREQIRQIIERG